jgi:hypothetical protein
VDSVSPASAISDFPTQMPSLSRKRMNKKSEKSNSPSTILYLDSNPPARKMRKRKKGEKKKSNEQLDSGASYSPSLVPSQSPNSKGMDKKTKEPKQAKDNTIFPSSLPSALLDDTDSTSPIVSTLPPSTIAPSGRPTVVPTALLLYVSMSPSPSLSPSPSPSPSPGPTEFDFQPEATNQTDNPSISPVTTNTTYSVQNVTTSITVSNSNYTESNSDNKFKEDTSMPVTYVALGSAGLVIILLSQASRMRGSNRQNDDMDPTISVSSGDSYIWKRNGQSEKIHLMETCGAYTEKKSTLQRIFGKNDSMDLKMPSTSYKQSGHYIASTVINNKKLGSVVGNGANNRRQPPNGDAPKLFGKNIERTRFLALKGKSVTEKKKEKAEIDSAIARGTAAASSIDEINVSKHRHWHQQQIQGILGLENTIERSKDKRVESIELDKVRNQIDVSQKFLENKLKVLNELRSSRSRHFFQNEKSCTDVNTVSALVPYNQQQSNQYSNDNQLMLQQEQHPTAPEGFEDVWDLLEDHHHHPNRDNVTANCQELTISNGVHSVSDNAIVSVNNESTTWALQQQSQHMEHNSLTVSQSNTASYGVATNYSPVASCKNDFTSTDIVQYNDKEKGTRGSFNDRYNIYDQSLSNSLVVFDPENTTAMMSTINKRRSQYVSYALPSNLLLNNQIDSDNDSSSTDSSNNYSCPENERELAKELANTITIPILRDDTSSPIYDFTSPSTSPSPDAFLASPDTEDDDDDDDAVHKGTHTIKFYRKDSIESNNDDDEIDHEGVFNFNQIRNKLSTSLYEIYNNNNTATTGTDYSAVQVRELSIPNFDDHDTLSDLTPNYITRNRYNYNNDNASYMFDDNDDDCGSSDVITINTTGGVAMSRVSNVVVLPIVDTTSSTAVATTTLNDSYHQQRRRAPSPLAIPTTSSSYAQQQYDFLNNTSNAYVSDDDDDAFEVD